MKYKIILAAGLLISSANTVFAAASESSADAEKTAKNPMSKMLEDLGLDYKFSSPKKETQEPKKGIMEFSISSYWLPVEYVSKTPSGDVIANGKQLCFSQVLKTPSGNIIYGHGF